MPNIKSAMKRDEKSKLQNLIHKNNAAHKKSAMAQKMNELG